MRLTSPFVSKLYGKYGRLHVSQPYEPPRPVTGIALNFFPSVKHPQIELKYYPVNAGL
jgi:hypothetical protein